MFELLLIILFCLFALSILFPIKKKKSRSQREKESLYRKITKMSNAIYRVTCSDTSDPTCRRKTKLGKKSIKRI